MGLKFLVKEEKDRLPQISTIMVPEGIDEAEVRSKLLSEFNVEIGAGLGPLAGKVWRFGLMGYTANSANVMLCLSALGSILSKMGYPVKVGEARGCRSSVLCQSAYVHGSEGSLPLLIPLFYPFIHTPA